MPNLPLIFDATKYCTKQAEDFFEFCNLFTIHNMNFNSKCVIDLRIYVMGLCIKISTNLTS